MKLKNVEVGIVVQIKENIKNTVYDNVYAGKFGRVAKVLKDQSDGLSVNLIVRRNENVTDSIWINEKYLRCKDKNGNRFIASRSKKSNNDDSNVT